ncbi:MAG: tetratricopeptide repeat protein [Deltaproteobacteria bacterium]|nr:tetratricopeptide repeat protein [Deltaproteobacteria bacterium]
MKRNKTTIIVFLASIPGLIAVLCWGVTAFPEDQPAEPALFHATPQQQAAAYLKEQVSDISEQLLKDFPKDIYFVQTSVSFHRLCKNYYKAIGVLEQASKDLPNNFWVHNIAAEVYFNNGEYEKALAHSRKALDISPKTLSVQDNVADSLFHLGRYSEAVELLEEKIKTSPHSARSYWLLGQTYVQQEQLEEAKEYYQKALELNPGHPEGNYWLAKVCMRLKQPDEAKEYMLAHKAIKAEEEKRRHAWAESRGAYLGKDTSNTEIIAFPIALAGLSVRGNKLYQTQKNINASKRLLDKAEAAFEKTIEINPQQHTVYQQFAFFYLNAEHKPKKAREYAEKALALNEAAESYFILGLSYEKTAKNKDALTAFEKAMKLEPETQKYRVKYNELSKRND